MNLQWVITRMLKNTAGEFPGAVVEVHWRVNGRDESGNKGFFLGVTKTNEVDPNNFTDFDSLTEEQVLSWVKNSSETYSEEYIEEQIRLQISLQSIQTVAQSDFPWMRTE